MGKIKKQLSKAIRQNNFDLVWQLLQEDFNKSLLNQVDKYNSTYLIDAIIFSSLDIVELLLKKGADVNTTNSSGDSALSEVIENYYIPNRLDKAKLILSYKVNPEITKYSLHLAAGSYKSSDIVQLLIDYGLNVNLQDEYGDTPLIKSSLNSTGEQSIIYLIKAEADLKITNYLGIDFSFGLIAYEHHQVLNLMKKEKINLESLLNQHILCKEKIDNNFKNTLLEQIPSYANHLLDLIVFFGLSASEQLIVLPTIEKRIKFDIGGDFNTDRALMVLTLEYQYALNSWRSNFILLEDDYPQESYSTIYYTNCLINNWIEAQDIEQNSFWDQSSLLKPTWILIRKLSWFLKQYLQIENDVTQEDLEKIIVDCLHY